jgi:hypothetical protein
MRTSFRGRTPWHNSSLSGVLRPRRAVWCLALISCSLGVAVQAVGEAPRPVPHIPAGTRFDQTPPEGWSHIVLFVEGRLGSGDLSKVSSTVREYSQMFNLVFLADVQQREDKAYELKKYGVGFSMKINGMNTVITPEKCKELGADLGMIGRSVFAANQESLSQIKELARFSTCALFDAPTMMLYEGEHYLMTVRYLIWVSRSTGHISTFVWLLDREGDSGEHRLVERTLQLLPENMREDRVMNVLGERFTFGIPSKDAFALVRIPQGRSVTITPRLAQVAGAESYDASRLRELLEAISEAASHEGQAARESSLNR